MSNDGYHNAVAVNFRREASIRAEITTDIQHPVTKHHLIAISVTVS